MYQYSLLAAGGAILTELERNRETMAGVNQKVCLSEAHSFALA